MAVSPPGFCLSGTPASVRVGLIRMAGRRGRGPLNHFHRVGLLRAEQAGDLAARRRRRGYVNDLHRVSLLPVLYVAGVVYVAPVEHPQDLAHRA